MNYFYKFARERPKVQEEKEKSKVIFDERVSKTQNTNSELVIHFRLRKRK